MYYVVKKKVLSARHSHLKHHILVSTIKQTAYNEKLIAHLLANYL